MDRRRAGWKVRQVRRFRKLCRRHPRKRVIQYSRGGCGIRRSRGVLGRPVKAGDDTGYVVSRAPSRPAIRRGTTLPIRSPAIATGR